MASPVPSYPQSGPGPSNYYSPRSPSSPRFSYTGNNQAGPSNVGYQYPQYAHGIHPPPRVSARGGVPYNQGRGGSHYQQGMHLPPQQHYHHPPPHPSSAHYAPQPMKYPQNYPPPPPQYMQPAVSYAPPSWPANQPLSPLPKQLSMPPPRDPSYRSPIMSPASAQSVMSISPVVSSPIPQHYSPSLASPVVDLPPQPPPLPPPPPPSVPDPNPVHTTEETSSMSVSTSSAQSASPSSALSTSTSSTASGSSSRPRPTWVIWSKRPQNPSLAPGIIFSPLSKPPPNVVAGAMQLEPPEEEEAKVPPTTQDPTALTLEDLVINEKEDKGLIERSSSPAQEELSPPVDEERESQPSWSHTNSSAVTETSVTPTIHSPESSNTSLSAGGDTPIKDKGTEELEEVPPAALVPEPEQVSQVKTPTPTQAPAKKSWASLLRPSTIPSSSSKPSPAAKNALPTSSVVGFSIPASATATSANSELISLLSSKPPSMASTVSAMKIRPRGIINTGNMCFANSVLQVLLYCPHFFWLFSELGRILKPREGGDLTEAVIKFLKDFTTEKNKKTDDDGDREDDEDAFIPTYVYDAMKEKKRFDHMRGGQQEDAEEFFGFFLDTLEEELLALSKSSTSSVEQQVEEEPAPPEDGWMEVGKKNRTVVTRTTKTTESPITRIFGGKFRSTVRAPGQKDSAVVEDWRALQLDIQRDSIHTIQDALSSISDPQQVQMGSTNASQQVQIDSLPPVLVLHMKRFCYDMTVGGVTKVGKQVRFEPELDLPSNIMSPSAKKQYPHARYRLFGAVYHHGISASGGHYTLDVLHPNRFPGDRLREGWVRVDDELVSDVRADDVFDAFDKDDTRCAYLLFYHRIR